MTRDDRNAERPNDTGVPPLGSWPRLYALVVAWLIVTIALLALLSRGCE